MADGSPLFWVLMIGIPLFFVSLGLAAIYFSEKSKQP